MARNLTILAAALAGLLGWAYVVSHPEGGATSGSGKGVAVWDVAPRDVARIVFRDGDERVEIEPRWKDGEEKPYLWVTTQHRPARKKAKPAAVRLRRNLKGKAAKKTSAKETAKSRAKGTAKARGKRTEQPALASKAFRGNRAAERLFEQLVLLRSPRAIGRLEKLKAKEFGFPAAGKTIEIHTLGKETLLLEVGADTYGKNLFYGHSKTDGKVYLVRKSVLSRLQKARTSLVDRRLFSTAPARAERIVLTMGGKSKTLWRLQGDEPGWGAEEGETGADPAMRAFVERLGKIRVGSFATPEDKARAGVTALELTVHQKGSSRAAEKLQVFSGEGSTLQVLSSHTRTSVRITRHQLQPLLNEGEKILKGS